MAELASGCQENPRGLTLAMSTQKVRKNMPQGAIRKL